MYCQKIAEPATQSQNLREDACAQKEEIIIFFVSFSSQISLFILIFEFLNDYG